ncbi:uncharacterized protein EI90DRAFT_3155929 [Cantharellus anzutake]|uniref:uncharacterized protein n=1 Tax=Cantharellus anzutake TaxID=1750568 RepID=UPI001904B720|nr:uncharacterized protein EI90DRAFT_3155929 [Cantharellus anzutake]KAF8328213.1 hypothetical protein EI90DRAFT_3155929 [Cantharellus anzutake]
MLNDASHPVVTVTPAPPSSPHTEDFSAANIQSRGQKGFILSSLDNYGDSAMNFELPSPNKSCQPCFSDPELSDSSSLSTSGSGSPVGIQLGLDIADETLDGNEAVGSDQDYHDNIAPLDISEDPLFQQSDAIFKWLEGQKSQPDALGELETLPSAFRESPPIRNAYIHAFIMSSYHGATHAAVSEFLQGQRALFQCAQFGHRMSVLV